MYEGSLISEEMEAKSAGIFGRREWKWSEVEGWK
jgi:hypothetical protein